MLNRWIRRTEFQWKPFIGKRCNSLHFSSAILENKLCDTAVKSVIVLKCGGFFKMLAHRIVVRILP